MSKKESKLSYGGHDHEFVGKIPDRCNCQICTKVLRDPHLTVCCGQHFCESCLNKWFTRQHKESCPHCRAEGEGFNHVINKGLRSEINQLKVKCSNRGKGCEWTGELQALKTHLESEKGCEFVVVKCPNKCHIHITAPWHKVGGGQGRLAYTTVMRKELDRHLSYECYLRPYKCGYCGEKGTYREITGKPAIGQRCYGAHYDKCPAYPLACPNECGANGIKRRDMESHRSQCPQEPVECPFTEAGCTDYTLRRHQLDNHLASNLQKHLLLMMGAYKQVKDKLMETEAKLTTALQLSQGTNEDKETMNAIIAYSPALMKNGDNLTITMPKVSEYHRSGKTWYSPPFYYTEGYKMCLVVSGVKMESGRCTGLSVSIKLLQGENDDKLKWPIPGHAEHHHFDIPPPPSQRTAHQTYIHMCGLKQFETRNDLYKQTLNSSILVNGCLTFSIKCTKCYLYIVV